MVALLDHSLMESTPLAILGEEEVEPLSLGAPLSTEDSTEDGTCHRPPPHLPQLCTRL